jgi:hypothetical protein
MMEIQWKAKTENVGHLTRQRKNSKLVSPELRHDFLNGGIGCHTLAVAQPDPSNKTDYDVWIRFSSSHVFSINVETLLQLSHPLEKNSNECLTRDGLQNDLSADQKLG